MRSALLVRRGVLRPVLGRVVSGSVPRACLRVSRGQGAAVVDDASGGRVRPTAMPTNGVTEAPCWNCHKGHEVVDRFCGDCHKLQAPYEQDFFSLLGVEPSFDLDRLRLEDRYRELLRKLHPDQYASQSKLEQRFAAAHATLVNEAYQVLASPPRRARYLLKQRGVDLGETAVMGRPSRAGRPVSPEEAALLAEIMDRREAVEEATHPRDLLSLMEETQNALASAEREASQAFRSEDMDRCVLVTMRLLYLDAVFQELRQRCPVT